MHDHAISIFVSLALHALGLHNLSMKQRIGGEDRRVCGRSWLPSPRISHPESVQLGPPLLFSDNPREAQGFLVQGLDNRPSIEMYPCVLAAAVAYGFGVALAGLTVLSPNHADLDFWVNRKGDDAPSPHGESVPMGFAAFMLT